MAVYRPNSDRAAIEAASRIVYETMPPTPLYAWPLLSQRLGAELWVKHENCTPIGAFKIRGALVYFRHLRNSNGRVRDVVTASRGNDGQAVGFAARREGISATVYVPHGNSVSENCAMRALGVIVVVRAVELKHVLIVAGSVDAPRREA